MKEKVWALKKALVTENQAHPQKTAEGMFSADQKSSKSWFIFF